MRSNDRPRMPILSSSWAMSVSTLAWWIQSISVKSVKWFFRCIVVRISRHDFLQRLFIWSEGALCDRIECPIRSVELETTCHTWLTFRIIPPLKIIIINFETTIYVLFYDSCTNSHKKQSSWPPKGSPTRTISSSDWISFRDQGAHYSIRPFSFHFLT